MVSLWPWRIEDNSPASFEKTLSALATTISKLQTNLETLRLNSRRYHALWILYTSFLYIFGLAVLVLVVGWKNWTIWEGSALAGWPLLIYIGRITLKTYYNYRIDTVSQHLEEQQAKRFRTLEKLKAATKYNSTLELLEKYGSNKSSPKNSSSPKVKRSLNKKSTRTSITPPLTANIPRPDNFSIGAPNPQLRKTIASDPSIHFHASSSQESIDSTTPGPPEFAPNAFSFSPEYAPVNENSLEAHWYDRLFDLLLGENETLPKNRVVLICQKCRLVNGQAPPGTVSLENLGKWRCYGCNSMNGGDVEAFKAVNKLKYGVEDPDANTPEVSAREKLEDELPSAQASDTEKEAVVNEIEVKQKTSHPIP